MACFRATDENNLAIGEILRAARFLDHHWPAVNFLATNCFHQVFAKGIVSQNADLEWLIRVGERSLLPGDELGKVKEERRFDLIFLGLSVEHRGRERQK